VVIDDENFHPSEGEVISCIRKLLHLLRSENICLAIENHDRFTSLALERIIKETDSTIVGICLDTANSLGALEGPYETIKILAPYTFNLHIKDIRIARLNHKMGFAIEGCAAGDGMLNIPWIIEYVRKYGKCKTAMLEVWSNPEKTIEQTIINERDLVNKSLQYLKKYFHD
jgi:sugar phosphate isomerase/epimerase